MKLFSRKPEAPAAPAEPAPAKQTRKVTCAELNGAINAACDKMYAGCSTHRTLQALLVDDAADGEIFQFKGPAPVNLTQFDEALADLENYELPASTLSSLKRVRVLLARAETQEAKAAGAPVPRAEFEAAQAANALALMIISDMLHNPLAGPLGVRLEVAAQSAEFESSAAGIRSLLDRIEKTSRADGARQMRGATVRLTR
jgi:hypothetical protein